MRGGTVPEAIVRRLARGAPQTFPDDPAWAAIAPVALVRAQDGGPVAQPTAVRIAHDGTRLFVRFDCDDRDVWSTMTRRDDALWEEEVVEVFIAPGSADPTAYVEIQTNPGGAIFDARVENPDGERKTLRVDTSWDSARLEVRIVRGAGAWSAVLAVPWRDLTSGDPHGAWRANFFRIERPRDGIPEFSCWSPTLVDPPDFHKPRAFGRLRVERASVADDR